MKPIQRGFFLSLIPIFTPLTALTAFAEMKQPADEVTSASKGEATSTSWRASQIMGVNVKNSANETIGEIEDIIIDAKSGEIIAVIISSGGFLGIADTLSAIPISSLRYDASAETFKTGLTRAQLTKAPHFKTDAWPDYNNGSAMESLRTFRDSIGGDVDAPDNTAQNEKEMTEDSLDPTDQGNSESDTQMTKNIRSGIMDSEMSFNAKNIKIITLNGNVTLKGVVESTEEHAAVLKIANSHANESRITDELKVNSK